MSESEEVISSREALILRARQMAEEATRAALGTLDDEGYPYTSLVEPHYGGGHFWLLLSNLATHSKNIGGDVRASLLVWDEQEGDEQETLARSRASFLGRIVAYEEGRAEIADDYVARHPQAAKFLQFSDFKFYRFRIERVRVVDGFGRIGWVDGEKL